MTIISLGSEDELKWWWRMIQKFINYVCIVYCQSHTVFIITVFIVQFYKKISLAIITKVASY